MIFLEKELRTRAESLAGQMLKDKKNKAWMDAVEGRANGPKFLLQTSQTGILSFGSFELEGKKFYLGTEKK